MTEVIKNRQNKTVKMEPVLDANVPPMKPELHATTKPISNTGIDFNLLNTFTPKVKRSLYLQW